MQVKPTPQEEEYFARLEFERRRRRILEVARGRCPKCAGELDQVTGEDTSFLGGVRRIFT